MPIVDSDGCKIFYELEGAGYPLFIHHGLGGSIKSWRDEGYIAPLAERYRLILMHARGHGKSDRPRNPEAYSNNLMADDVVAVLNDQGIERAHFYGYSMGGRVGLTLCKYAPLRFSSMIIGGMGVKERDAKSVNENRSQVNIMLQGFDAFISALEKERGRKLSEQDLAEWRSVDLKTLAAVNSLEDIIGFEEYLPQVDISTMFYAGTSDRFYSYARKGAEMMPNARFVFIQGLDHESGFNRSDLVLPHVLQFLDEQNE